MKDAGEIVRQFAPMVWKTVNRIVGGAARAADAEDCFQDIFVAALEVDRREKVRNWEALLRRIATLKALDVLRRRVRERKRSAGDDLLDILPGARAAAEDVAQRRELVALLQDNLSELPEQQAETFCLRYVSDMSYDEIADQLGITVNAVGVILHRAKAKLQELMEPRPLAMREVPHGA